MESLPNENTDSQPQTPSYLSRLRPRPRPCHPLHFPKTNSNKPSEKDDKNDKNPEPFVKNPIACKKTSQLNDHKPMNTAVTSDEPIDKISNSNSSKNSATDPTICKTTAIKSTMIKTEKDPSEISVPDNSIRKLKTTVKLEPNNPNNGGDGNECVPTTYTGVKPKVRTSRPIKTDEQDVGKRTKRSTSTVRAFKSAEPRWGETNALKLLTLFKTEGFGGNLIDLAKHFPETSSNNLRYLFLKLRNKNEEEISQCKFATVSHSLIKLQKQDPESSNLGENIPLFLEFEAMFGHFPEPSQVGDVDYPAILRCVASLARGVIPKQLNPSSAAKLISLINLLQDNIHPEKKLLDESQPIPDYIQMPIKKEPTTAESRNAYLAHRRSKIWSEAEKIDRSKVQSLDLSEVRKFYLTRECFNPFKFPSEK